MAEPGPGQPGGNRQQQMQIAQQLEQQLGQLEEQKTTIQSYISDLEETQEAIETLSEQDTDEALLIPLGSGAYVHAKIAEPDKVLASLGGGILAEEQPEKAIERLENRKQEAQGATEEIDENIEQMRGKLEQLVAQMQGGQVQQTQVPDDE